MGVVYFKSEQYVYAMSCADIFKDQEETIRYGVDAAVITGGLSCVPSGGMFLLPTERRIKAIAQETHRRLIIALLCRQCISQAAFRYRHGIFCVPANDCSGLACATIRNINMKTGVKAFYLIA